jgi:hypothetical protein
MCRSAISVGKIRSRTGEHAAAKNRRWHGHRRIVCGNGVRLDFAVLHQRAAFTFAALLFSCPTSSRRSTRAIPRARPVVRHDDQAMSRSQHGALPPLTAGQTDHGRSSETAPTVPTPLGHQRDVEGEPARAHAQDDRGRHSQNCVPRHATPMAIGAPGRLRCARSARMTPA